MLICGRSNANPRGEANGSLGALTSVAILLAGLAVAACGGGGDHGAKASDTAAPSIPAAPDSAGNAVASGAAGAATATNSGATATGAAATAGAITPQMIPLGDSIFHGQVAGGTCTTCHGQDAKGTQLAPDLTDKTWLNGDGSYHFIVHTVTTGVPQPKQHPAPMPPMGGASLTPDQIRAVAAYVYSLSHPLDARGTS